MVKTISGEISRFSEEEYFSHLIPLITKFGEISGVSKYVTDDSENYYDKECYVNLLISLGELSEGVMSIQDVTSTDDDGNFVINCKLSGNEQTIQVPAGSDWINDEFIDQLNGAVSYLELGKSFQYVCPTTVDNSDQFFSIAFVSDETIQNLRLQGFANN